jgi:tetratricopeptide (TPR) repeat protein
MNAKVEAATSAVEPVLASQTESPRDSKVTSEIPPPESGGLTEEAAKNAERVYDKAVRNPSDMEAFCDLAMVYYQIAPASSIPLLQKCVAQKPKEMRWLYFLGMAYEDAFEPAKALEAFRKALAIDPDYPPLLVKTAGQLAESDSAEAQKLFLRAAEISPRSVAGCYARGRAAALRGEWEAATKHYGEALIRAPQHDEINRAMAAALRRINRADEARRYDDSAYEGGKSILAEDPLQVELMSTAAPIEYSLAIAEVVTKQGDLELAHRIIARAMQHEDVELCRRALGDILRLKGLPEEACEHYRRAIKLDSKDLPARLGLAEALIMRSRFGEAEKELREAYATWKSDPIVMNRLSQLLLQTQQAGQAEPILQRLYMKRPDDRTVQVDSIADLVSLGNLKGAVALFTRANATSTDVNEALINTVVLRLVILLAEQKQYRTTTQPGGEPLTLGHLNRFADALAAAELVQEAEKVRNHLKTIVMEAVITASRHQPEKAMLMIQQALGADRGAVLRNGLVRVYQTMRQNSADRGESNNLIISAQPKNPAIALGWAWILATSPDDAARNGAKALEFAKFACEATGSNDADYLDVLAAAQAETGNFDEAVSTIRQAIDLSMKASGDPASLAGYQARLKLYESKLPYRAE